MSGPKIEMAKESARATAEVLEPDDLISVIAFDNQPYTVVRLQRASNRLRISTDIARLQPGGGTNILPALQEAYQVLAPVNAKVKHVILLSDGQAGYEGIAEVCREMRANRITVSAVGIGDADRNLLQLVAENGEGRFYLAEDASELPKIFVKETQEVQKSQLVEDVVKAIVAKKVETIEYPELGMEAIWRIEVEDFPAFIIIDDKGNDFYAPFEASGSKRVQLGR